MTGQNVILNIISGGIIGLALEYFGMSGEVIIIMTVVLLLDFLAGISEVRIKDRKNLSSTKARQGLFRKISRWLLPFIIIIIIKGAGIENASYLSTAVCGIIIVSEGYSILAHIYAINQPGDKRLPEVDALSALIERVANLFKSKVDDTLKK